MQSSIWCELYAIHLVLESFKLKLSVRWFSDNQNVIRIVQYGSSKPVLQSEALGISSICMSSHIWMEPEWIPRDKNELSDYDDYML